MKKLFLAMLFSWMSVAAMAVEMPHHSKETGFYFVTKALVTTGETVEHGAGVTLASEAGNGVGIDFGYKLPKHFAVELDVSYDHNMLTEDNNGVVEEADGKYWTYAVDVTYTMHMTHALGLMGKVGYEIEDEKIEALHIEEKGQGLVYGLGLEFAFSDHYEFVAEYEHSSIESTRGSSIYSGIKYNF